MPAASRSFVDVWAGICCCHPPYPCIPMGGPIITGSWDHSVGNFGQARLVDMTIGACGHPGTIVTGAPYSLTNNLGKARVGELVVGCNMGVIVTGLPDSQVCNGGGAVTSLSTLRPFPSRTIEFEGQEITYTEVDFGTADDDPTTDDGLNIMPPVVGRPPTAAEQAKSDALDVSPDATAFISTDTVQSPDTTSAPVSCITVPEPAPDSTQLTPNFTLGQVSSQAVLSLTPVRAQAGFTYQEVVCNLQAWCQDIGEPLLAQFGTFLITSGFRSGSGSSQHHRGQAIDLQFPSKTNQEVYDISVWIKDTLPYDQLILEYGGNKPWIHSSFNRAGNRPVTQGNKFGTRISPGNYAWRTLKYFA